MDLAQQIFTNTDIIDATGVNPTTLQAWVNRGIVSLADQQRAPGAGQRRAYSALDVAGITAIQAFVSIGLSVAAAAKIVRRLEDSPKTADAWRKALEQAPRHIFVLVPEGDNEPMLRTAAVPIETPNETPVAAMFDIGPPVARAMETLRDRCRSTESACDPTSTELSAARVEREREPEPVPLPAAQPRAVIPGEYPRYKYHRYDPEKEPVVVADAEEDAALGEEWQDLPLSR